MGQIQEKAKNRFQKNYNCCQAVACACCEQYGINEEDMFRLTEGFGSGIGGLKDTCGAVMGIFLILSLKNSAGNLTEPMLTKFDTYDKIQKAAEKFRKCRGSLYCRDLKTEEGTQPLSCCMACVEDAAGILEEMLENME